VPLTVLAVLEEAGGDPSGWTIPPWNLADDDAFSHAIGVGTTIFSVTAPGPTILAEPEAAAKLARELNEYCAKVRDIDPTRYGFFASVPSLLDTERCLAEIRHALDDLRADGIILFTRYGHDNHYLGHPDFIPSGVSLTFTRPSSLSTRLILSILTESTPTLLSRCTTIRMKQPARRWI